MPGKRGQFIAHDVRHLAPCEQCGEMGDDRDMIQCAERAYVHTSCAYERLADRVLDLPRKEREKLRLCDVPPAIMRQLLDNR